MSAYFLTTSGLVDRITEDRIREAVSAFHEQMREILQGRKLPSTIVGRVSIRTDVSLAEGRGGDTVIHGTGPSDRPAPD